MLKMTFNYRVEDCVVFCKTRNPWGEFSNMHTEYPLQVGEHTFRTAEHLYQSMKHLDKPELIRRIMDTPSPITAKHIAYEALPYVPGVPTTAEDPHHLWIDHYAIDVMTATVGLKYLQYKDHFESLRAELNHRKIVEYSTKDGFWGMRRNDYDPSKLTGQNHLGLIWMKVYRLAELDKLRPSPVFNQLIEVLQ